MRRLLWLPAVLGAVVLATVVWATTYHTVTVDGNLADFSVDEKTAGDPLGDSLYGANNDLSALYVTWDAQKLYIGFEYKAEQVAVMYLIETGKSGGVTNFCAAGYTGAFPANVQGPAFDLMVAFYASANHSATPTPYVYTLQSNGSTDITSTTGVEAKLIETVSGSGRVGSVEAAIPWSTIYGLGPGVVPANAKLQIAGVIRGNNNNDGVGDVSPDPSGGVKTGACSGAATVLDPLHVITIDTNGDGVPETGWAPGPNLKVDAGPTPDTKPAADTQPAPDTTAADTKPAPDTKLAADTKPAPDTKLAADTKSAPDTKPAADTKPAPDTKPKVDTKPAPDTKPSADVKLGDKRVVDALPQGDGKLGDRSAVMEGGGPDLASQSDKRVTKADAGGKKPSEQGCACSVASSSGDLASGLLLLALLGLCRRRRRSPRA